MAEKQVNILTESQASHSDDDNQDLIWLDAEEKALVRKIDLIVMSLLMLGFFALQLDRGNIGNALTDFLLREVGITQYQFNTGQLLLSAGIVLLEIPSNLILFKIGPALWIGSQIVTWQDMNPNPTPGLVATLQAFIKGKGVGPYLATRLLLGLCEAGFIPAGLYAITRWYKRDETTKRFSWFFIGNMFAVACSGLVAYGILHMRGVCDLSGWQWLFLIEGMFTVIVGFAFISLFPKAPGNPVSVFGYRYFNERESQILLRRVLLDDPSKAQTQQHISGAEIKAAVTNWKLIPHVILTLCALAPSSTLFSYAPTLVVSFGYDRLTSNAMVSIGAWILLATNISWGIVADRWGRRGPLVAFGLLLLWGFTACFSHCGNLSRILGNQLLVESSNPKLRFALLTLSIAFGSNWHPVNGSWMALNCKSAGERSITMAIFIMAANTSGIIGSQLFQPTDAPLYKKGWTVILALETVALVMAVVAILQYYVLNRRQSRKGDGMYKH
ncbi:major facilitator superfamily domain-containing protein [Bombardia bombarda]|uniref:Major facilitator superfamily domain-containing protein n=1 Tax=Bombardia bombarda TaxID=252184 RepID=A0AA39WZP9_9PEZI|nr:major facilitator superfamily domain-containing protein [Bombardia bombarda]